MNQGTMLRVFVDDHGNYGDLVPVVVDEGRKLSIDERVRTATELDGVETVFVNDVPTNNISIVHSRGEIPFAGTVAIGAAWFLSDLHGRPITVMQGRDGVMTTHQEDDVVWVTAELSTMPGWNIVQVDSAEEVESMTVENNRDAEHTLFWAWQDEQAGTVRARTFAPDWGIPEAEANGSGAMLLASQLNQKIIMTQGKGSVVYAQPEPNNHASLGGRVTAIPII